MYFFADEGDYITASAIAKAITDSTDRHYDEYERLLRDRAIWLTKTDQKIEYGNAWFMIFDINAERKIYFREDLILPEEGSVARPHIISSFLNEKGEIFYSAAIYQNGTVIMNDIVLADGSQGADDVIIFSGTLSGLKPEGPEESGISEYQLNQGSYEILDDNDVIFSGISNPANFQITRVAHPGYIVAPETSVVNITKNDVYFTATLNIESDQLTKEATVMKIYKEGLASSLSTENFENNSFGMYPNPTSGNIFFKEDMNMTGKTADIFDLTGRKIISHKFISGSNPIDLGALSTGMYLIRITENGKILGSKKILKQ